MKRYLFEPMFSAEIYIFLGPIKEVHKHLVKRGIAAEESGEAKAAKCMHITNGAHDECLLWFHPEYIKGLKKGDPEAWSIVAHECHHAMRYILAERGVGDDNETRSYFLDWLVENVGRTLSTAR
jgi:hypothetical protein